MVVTDSKLGGYILGGDENTAAPSLWEWLIVEQGVKSVIDIGCGEGIALEYFAGHGVTVHGVDAIQQPKAFIHQHNYREDSYWPGRRFDLAWSCEFVEHVEEQHVPNFMRTFQCADLALITHATPGQNGWNHVNCQPAEYWIKVFDDYGFDYDEELTMTSRSIAESEKWSYYVATGLAFRQRP